MRKQRKNYTAQEKVSARFLDDVAKRFFNTLQPASGCLSC